MGAVTSQKKNCKRDYYYCIRKYCTLSGSGSRLRWENDKVVYRTKIGNDYYLNVLCLSWLCYCLS